MRKLALLLAFVLVPAQAWALNVNTSDLLATIAMPLAVAAVSHATGVSESQLADLVTSLNQANVPPTQFVEVIRYVPAVFYDQNGQPFVAYVQQQASQGVTGDALVNAIVSRLQTNYNVTPVLDLNGEPTTVVMSDNYVVVPNSSTTQLVTTTDPLALIGLPLAVAAVSDISGVPQDQLATLVATLNNANVPPVQEIQIIRYAPVALVSNSGQPFVQYIQQQTSQGVTGTALVPVVTQQLQTYYPAQTRVVVEHDYTPPPVVVSRVQEIQRGNPHGGPPGQIKKQLGLQTGAEVVRAQPAPAAPVVMVPREGHGHGHEKGHAVATPVAAPAPMISSGPPQTAPVVVAPPAVAPAKVPPGHAKGDDHGKDNGKGKGHGKD